MERDDENATRIAHRIDQLRIGPRAAGDRDNLAGRIRLANINRHVADRGRGRELPNDLLHVTHDAGWLDLNRVAGIGRLQLVQQRVCGIDVQERRRQPLLQALQLQAERAAAAVLRSRRADPGHSVPPFQTDCVTVLFQVHTRAHFRRHFLRDLATSATTRALQCPHRQPKISATPGGNVIYSAFQNCTPHAPREGIPSRGA